MIVTCPNCGARYRLAEDVTARGARLKCADCEHRWVPEAEPDPIAAAPVVLPPPEPEPPVPVPVPPPVPEPLESATGSFDVAADDGPPPSTLFRTIVALVLGLALAIAAAALWVDRIDPARLPGLGPLVAPLLDRLTPPAAPLAITIAGTVAELPSGGRVLEVTGRITNQGTVSVVVPPLAARLSGPLAPVRRWTIAPPLARLGPGESATFTSTITGFPADARTLSVTQGR